jgi:Zn-dependent protease
VLKTGGSMLISIICYTWLFAGDEGLGFGLKFATGFVLLILVHELGHSLAMRYYGLSASPPIFIPFLGALINLRQPPRNALEESVVGIAGPVLGTIGAVACYLLYLYTGELLLLPLAYFGFLLNLFNMLPVPPLDGGRATAAVSPWIWIPGLLGAVAWLIKGWIERGSPSFILILLLLYAWPRVRQVLASRGKLSPYYNISTSSKWMMGAAYVGLAALLFVLRTVAQHEIHHRLPGMFNF